MKKLLSILIIATTILLTIACEKDETPNEETTVPTIENFFASRDTIEFGGDTTTLTINATGGNLNYVWFVDLGDLFVKDEGRTAIFSGSECCVGMKDIICTVSNDKGEIDAIVNVYINEPEF